MAASKHVKIKLREVNRHLVCRLCRGYYVDATTIAECLHSFCRSCIIKYLEKNSFCPICEVQIHKTKPYLNLRLDKALQDVVYKLVPRLYHDEMKRRREFYAKCQEQIPFATPEQCGLEERIIFSPEDSISLSLEYLESDDLESETVSSQSSESGDNPDALSFPQQLGLMKLKNNDGKTSRRESQDVQETSVFPKRYLQCPAVVNIGHLKKFISMKHDLRDKMQVSIIHKRVPLPDHYTLMDVAYIYTWKRSAPLRFFYQIYQTKKHSIKIPPTLSERNELKSQTVTEELKSVGKVAGEKITNNDTVKPSSEIKVKNIGDKIEKINKSEPKQSAQNVLKNIDNNKPVSEVKPEPVKSEVSVNGVLQETKKELQTGPNTVPNPQNVKSDKTKIDVINSTEHKSKAEPHKRKNVKMENNGNSAGEVKENKSENSERLLLNPVSGQLESVSSGEQCKSGLNGTDVSGEQKEVIDNATKNIVNKGQKKTDLQSSKDLKKSNVNLLKSFRKEKLSAGKDGKMEIKSNRGSSLTITTVKTKNPENSAEKEPVKFSVEIKPGNKESEYDFDGSSPPSKIIPLQEFSKYSKYSKYMAEHREKWLSKESKDSWMSLQDFREKILTENRSNDEEAFKKNRKKVVPSLYKINSNGNKISSKKTPNGKLINDKPKDNKMVPNLINIKTEHKEPEDNLKLLQAKTDSPPSPIKIASKDGEYSVKSAKEKKTVTTTVGDAKPGPENKQIKENKKDDACKISDVTKESLKRSSKESGEDESPKNKIPNSNEIKLEFSGAIDLTKTETSPKSEKKPAEKVMEGVNKTSPPKKEEQMVEALLSASQKQSVEPLLKIPLYSQMLKNSLPQDSLTAVRNISQSEITQALQFLEDLRSDIKVLEAKNQLNPNSVLEHFAQKSGNFEPYQQLYQQKIDMIRILKRHQQISPNNPDAPQRKHLKLSPTSETKRKISPSSEQKAKTSPVLDEIAQYKSSLDRTLSQIQLMELQSRMLAAQSYKNLPALLQYYNRPATFCPGAGPGPGPGPGPGSGPTSPSKSNQQKIKPSSQSPNKSPQSLNSSGNSDSSFFNAQNYSHLINAGLSSEMTYHQMFQSYLNQQEQMNQVKLSQGSKKSIKFSEVSPKSLSDKYYSSQTGAKKQEHNNSVPSAQKS